MMPKQSYSNLQSSRVFCFFEILAEQEGIKLGDYEEFVKNLAVNRLERKGNYIPMKAITLHFGLDKFLQSFRPLPSSLSSPPQI
jgi:hypothetical protein